MKKFIRDCVEFAFYFAIALGALALIGEGMDFFFGVTMTAEEQAGLIPLAGGGWGY